MSLDATGATNFYYYGKPSDQIAVKTYPSGQKIWTQLPADIAKIRIGGILAFTTTFFLAVLKTPAISEWRWLVVIVGMTLAAWVTFKHLLTNDPLVETFYKIAGGKENYEKLPEFQLHKNKKTYENFDIAWASLKHPLYRFSTSDGRKGLVVKGVSRSKEHALVRREGTGPAHNQAMMIFVEKLGPCDVRIKYISDRILSILNAFSCRAWNNSFSALLPSGEASNENGSYRTIKGLYAYIPTDWANAFITQSGSVNQLQAEAPHVEQV
ncbi:MAG TPA: hypothetical protein VHK67_06265 [Rhabdochlamydiaceae bacterium]|jgi:hypothetical protein|nr:hypothetical protein [Rhabdochlamydiaceae bacterium]